MLDDLEKALLTATSQDKFEISTEELRFLADKLRELKLLREKYSLLKGLVAQNPLPPK